MRYEVRFGNGAWVTFDTLQYAAVDIHYTQRDAERSVVLANDWDQKAPRPAAA
jgi:hypothetical protein